MKRHLLGFVIALLAFCLACFILEAALYYQECFIQHDPPCLDPNYPGRPE
jgi:hypothetical protein